jgi:hypothetical protein
MKSFQVRPWFMVFAAACWLGSAALPAAADDDPPGRVARLSFVRGSVAFQPAGEQDWVEAIPNRPLTSGDSIWVDSDGRAELHVGSTAIRLAERTSLTILDLSDHNLQFSLAQGSMIVSLRHLDDDDLFEADTPNLAFSFLRPGEYRLDVPEDAGSASVAVWRGQGQVNGGGRTFYVVAGQQARFTGRDYLEYEIFPVPAPDRFSEWSMERDRREERADASNYVSRELTGYEDLDDYGRWRYAGAYGMVWEPVGVPLGWAPYRFGRWGWIEPWGWTWVDDQPWGFAPFHYGRWAFVGTGWVWIPGPVAVRPVYAPALVAFVGGGPGAGFALTIGGGPGVGWFPLGPGEVFVPAYRVSPVYVTNVNITNTRVEATHVTNVYNYYTTRNTTTITRVNYVNQQVPGAVTAVSRETFVNARPVAANVVQVNREEMARAPVSHIAALAPVRTSVTGGASQVSAAPPAALVGRKVVTNRMPPPPPPSFSKREPALNEHPGEPPARGEFAPVVHGTAATPAPHAAPVQPVPVQPIPVQPTLVQPVPVSPAPVHPTPTPVPSPPAAAPRPAPIEQVGTPQPRVIEQAPRTTESHPNVQLAPPARPKTQQESQEEERKFEQWQKQRQEQLQQQKPPAPSEPRPQEKQKPAEKEKQQKEKPASGRPQH